MTNEYSSLKAAWHIKKISRLRDGLQIVPTHVQLIISDLCNQNCLVAGTMIECPSGSRPIEEICVGDYVIGADGNPVKVEVTGSREVTEIYEVSCDGRRICASGEHPILTQDGWKEVSHINPFRDSAVVRMRMRGTGEKKGNKWEMPLQDSVESLSSWSSLASPRILQGAKDSKCSTSRKRSPRRSNSAALHMWLSAKNKMEFQIQKMGSLYLWSWAHSGPQLLRRLEGAYAASDTKSSPPNMPVWVQAASRYTQPWSWAFLGRLYTWASTTGAPRFAFGGCSETYVRSYEETQPNVRSRSGEKSTPNTVSDRISNKDRTSVFKVGHGEQTSDKFLRYRAFMDQSQKSRLQSSRPKESYRGFYLWDFQWWRSGGTYSRRLWTEVITTLRRKWLAVFSGILSTRSSAPLTRQLDPSLERLLCAGIQLERNLELRPITSVRRLERRVRVYNFSCPPIESYISNGIVTHNCGFCAYRMDGGFSTEQFGEMKEGVLVKNPNRRIPKDKAIEILNDCADVGVKAIQFTGGGEPTVHPDHIEIFQHAHWLGLKTGLVTNGLVMRDPGILADMDWVRISLDAGRSESYEKIRESKGFEKVLKNIKTLVNFGNPCVIGIGFVVTRENWEEIGEACEIAKGLGVSYIRLSAMFSEEGSGYYTGLVPMIEEVIEGVKERETDSFKIVDLFSHRLDDLDQGSPKESFCGYQNFTVYVGGDQKVYRCCTTSYTKHGEVGNLKEQTFKEWLTSWEKKELYEKFDARSCHHCQFHSANEIINYMVNEEPTHVDFV